jgi:hypothetical protein
MSGRGSPWDVSLTEKEPSKAYKLDIAMSKYAGSWFMSGDQSPNPVSKLSVINAEATIVA